MIAYLALVLASIADVVTTMRGVRSGLLRERNPLMRPFTRSMTRALTVKAVALVYAWFALQSLADARPQFAVMLTWIGALGCAILAARNATYFRRESEKILENFSKTAI